MTEDEVRDKAKEILGFDDTETAKSGVGQLTTFNQLGFKGVNDKPDGWYLPNEKHFPAIILETKNSDVELRQPQIDELLKNCRIVAGKYKNVIGILYNGDDVLCFKNCQPVKVVKDLKNKEYYLGLFEEDTIDKQRIYTLTKRINDSLHFKFGINDLKHRMIFTACALVAKRYGATLVKGMDYTTFHTSIHSTLSKSLAEAKRQNQKLDLLLEVYADIKMNITNNQQAIDDFIDCVSEISDNINSDFWQGEDVMAIFFNEFTRYKGKSEHGQVFTPDHITSLMYRITETNQDDIVLDAACGSGAFLVKSMCNMIKDAGGSRTDKAKSIKQNQLYGIELDREIYALACANMLIHKDGKTNLEQLDSRTEEAARWIASKNITKVLMNPPFERKYGCIDIIMNVLDNVSKNSICAFIMPDKKLEKDSAKKVSKILKNHSLLKIVKLPENVFREGVTTSVFVFKTGVPQNDKEIFACYIEDDGLEAVKNQGRQDIKNRWKSIEDEWVEIIRKQSGSNTIQWLKPKEHLSYQMPQKAFEIYEEDFAKTAMDYLLFEQEVDVKQFAEDIANKVLYSLEVSMKRFLDRTKMRLNKQLEINQEKKTLSSNGWRDYQVGNLFKKVELKIKKGSFDKKFDVSEVKTEEFNLPLVNAKHFNNGIMYYGRKSDFEYENMTLDVVQNGAIATGDVYVQPQDTGVLWDAYLLKPLFNTNEHVLRFIATSLRKTLKEKYGYDDKCTWEKVKLECIKLPAVSADTPDYAYMEDYMKNIMAKQRANLEVLQTL